MPRKLGKYQLLSLLGRGATSAVYLAEDPFNQRQVAVKLIQRHGADTAVNELADAGLRTEAALLGKLNHPHIVKIFDVVDDGDDHYAVMEYVPGGTMERHSKRGFLLDYRSVVDTIFKCAKALEYMNGLGLIHRDIKPANILLTDNGDIRLTDLGATLLAAASGQLETGVGTPLYMSPEQLLAMPLEFRSDMYSLGVVFYELLTGEKPFDAPSINLIIYQILNYAPKPPSEMRPSIPAELDGIVKKMLGKLPSERYPSWQACIEALTSLKPAAEDRQRQLLDLTSASTRFGLLRDSPFFRLFSDADLWYVLEIATFHTIADGDVLIREGDIGDFFLVLLSGQVRISKKGRQIDLVSPGMSLGEISYVLEGRVPRKTTCVANTDGITVRINDAVLRRASAICRSRFEKTFLQTMASWLAEADLRMGASS